MTAQVMWHRDEVLPERGLSEQLPGGKNWDIRLRALYNTGVTKNHLETWSWILKGDTADVRLDRFLATTKHRPIFLLFLMVRSDHTFHDRQLFIALLEYITQTYTSVPMGEHGRPEQRGEKRALDGPLNMTPDLFVKLLSRLQFHASRLCPESGLKLAELITSYIQSRSAIGAECKEDTGFGTRFAAQCQVFNSALRILGRPAKSRPYANMEHNWDAQKHLLAFSSSLKRSLIINKTGYRAIQAVMIGREKSAGEEKVAIRSAKTWPPYRQAWDGIDEQRRPEDDLSRAVKTAIQAREAGYPETEHDRALGALGGAILGQSPTVQTRSRPPVVRKGKHAAEAILATWAARIRATRNAQEAWAIFRSPPQNSLKPSAPVYAEMMAKLVVGEVADPTSAVPGSKRENFPVYQSPNLSEFEKARIRPPTLEKLAEEMIDSGVQPVGNVLCLLIRHSNSETEVLHWLRQSPYKRFANELDPSSVTSGTDSESLKKIPLAVFNAYISFLCKMQGKEDSAASLESCSRPRDHYLKLAMQLIPARLKPDTQEGRTYKPPWLQVLQTMIMSKTHASLRNPAIRRERLSMFINLFSWVVHQTGMDSELLGLLCLSTGRVMAATFTSANHDQFRSMPDRTSASDGWWAEADCAHLDKTTKHLLEGLHRQLTKAFAEMKRSGSGISGFHVYSYMRTMGLFGDVKGMTGALDWGLLWLENGQTLGDAATAGTSSNAYLNLAFGVFETIARDRVDGDVLRSIETRRQALMDRGYPLEVPKLSERDLNEVALVSVVAKGWANVTGGEFRG